MIWLPLTALGSAPELFSRLRYSGSAQVTEPVRSNQRVGAIRPSISTPFATASPMNGTA